MISAGAMARRTLIAGFMAGMDTGARTVSAEAEVNTVGVSAGGEGGQRAETQDS